MFYIYYRIPILLRGVDRNPKVKFVHYLPILYLVIWGGKDMTRIQNGSLMKSMNAVPSGFRDIGYHNMSYNSPLYDIDPRRGTFVFFDRKTTFPLCPIPGFVHDCDSGATKRRRGGSIFQKKIGGSIKPDGTAPSDFTGYVR